ncbi:MAG TPA: DUF1343 domain-containing protein [Firmicutes bacterium]|nr:DUF1343 domain-containing protein [Bacillota bacterium]
MAKVKLGVENLLEDKLHLLSGKRVGLITSPTGLDSKLNSTVDLLFQAGVNLTALFGPEHGVRGNAQAGVEVGSEVDEKTKLPVHSLYGSTRKPTPEMLKEVDVLIFDMQDVGCRYYTFNYTMAYAQEAAHEHGLDFIVLDRPNPLGGLEVEGNLVHEGFFSFVGAYPLPNRYGLTIGELSLYFAEVLGVGKDPIVVEMTGYTREMFYEDTGLLWVPPSPNIPTVDTAIVYPGTCLFEGTNLSEGRGTTRPFEIIGAPWLDAFDLADKLNNKNLPGVLFRPVFFVPTFSKHANTECHGIHVHVTDRKIFQPLRVALHILSLVFQYKETEFLSTKKDRYFFNLLSGDPKIKDNIEAGVDPDEIWEKANNESKNFLKKAKSILLYGEA